MHLRLSKRVPDLFGSDTSLEVSWADLSHYLLGEMC